MNLKPEPKPVAGKTPRPSTPSGVAAKNAAGKSRPARRLFQPEAGPLESGVSPLLTVKRPRRRNQPLAVLAACLTLAGACAVPGANAAEPERSGHEETRNGGRNDRDRDGRRERQSSTSPSASSGTPSNSTASRSAAPSAQVPSKKVESFNTFALIAERNIFNPNRSPRRPGTTESRPRPKVVDSFALVGILAYEKGTLAFFDGSASEFKKVLKVSDQIAGYTIAEVNPGSVKLSKDGKTLDLNVGSQLRREEQGNWTLSNQPQNYAAAPPSALGPASSTAPPPTGPPGASDDVLKRLMQRREQE
jgi:hypothetical protein